MRRLDYMIRGTGAVLLALVVAPASGLLSASEGIAAFQFMTAAGNHARAAVVALAVVLGLGLAIWPVAGRVWGVLAKLSRSSWAEERLPIVSGIVAFLASASLSWIAFDGGPFQVDGMSQLLQARLFASGALVLPPELPIEFSYYQYLAPTAEGWASQYPPGFSALLALGLLVGLPWVVGPAIHAATAWLGVRVARELLGDDRMAVLLTAALLAASPLTVALAGAYMNHGLAALLGLVALTATLRSYDDHPGWRPGVVAGAAVGLIATVRPLTAVCVAAVCGILWLAAGRRRAGAEWLRFPGLAAVAALPPTLALFWYNATQFGSPLTFGYAAAQGPGHALGFHVDPWGAYYGPAQALAYAATELRALGTEIAGVPLPLTALAGLVLLWRGAASRALWGAILWAGSIPLAGFFYWHHDLSMGPRLLADAAPAWCLIVGWAAAAGVRGVGELRGAAPRGYVRAVALAAVLAAVVATPLRLSDYARAARVTDLLTSRGAPDGTLVFVHDTWTARLAGRLAGLGLRDDQIRRVLAGWSSCALQTELDGARPDGASDRLLRLASDGAGLAVRTMPSGSAVRTFEGEILTEACERQARSDFAGVAGLPQRSWRGALPGVDGRRAIYLRDMGPEANRAALSRFPERTPYVLAPEEPATSPVLWPYDVAMERRWVRRGTGDAP